MRIFNTYEVELSADSGWEAASMPALKKKKIIVVLPSRGGPHIEYT
jgi:hypothetical protein